MNHKPDLRNLLGQTITIRVDRPAGSVHPRDRWEYPINYGHVPGTRAGDGCEIDAYLLGCDQPVVQATGQVIAVIVRQDDIEDKLVVACDRQPRTAEQIWQAVAFQEQHFDITIHTA